MLKIKTTANPQTHFKFPDLFIYINQELYERWVDQPSFQSIFRLTGAHSLSPDYFKNALKDPENIWCQRKVYYNYYSEKNQQFGDPQKKNLYNIIKCLSPSMTTFIDSSNTQFDILYNSLNYGVLYCFTTERGYGQGYRINSYLQMGQGQEPSFGGFYMGCNYSSESYGYNGSNVSSYRFHVCPEDIVDEEGVIQGGKKIIEIVISIVTENDGTYTYTAQYNYTRNANDIVNYSMFVGSIPDNVSNDPYNEGDGSTGTGGGEGTFDPSGETIGVPSLPTISAIDTGFVSIWKPTKTELKNLYNYLWSGLDLNTFKKIFANPIDTIMGFSIIPLTPTTGTAKELKVGNIGTGINVTPVVDQYYEIDCGTITIPEFFGSYLDYEPYTTIDLYLPYIGSVRISTDDIKRNPPNNGTIQLIYHIDILSGSCVVFVVTNGTVSYQYNGSILTQLPITGNDFTSTINSVLGLTSNIVGGVMSASTGNAAGVLGNSVNAAHNVTSAKPSINRSGNISGSGGFLGIQKPFLIMNLPKQAIAFAQNTFTGYPAHITNSVKSLTGYTEFEQIWIEKVPATENELSEIESILTSGVIL